MGGLVNVVDATLVSVTFTFVGLDWPTSSTVTSKGVLGAEHSHDVAW